MKKRKETIYKPSKQTEKQIQKHIRWIKDGKYYNWEKKKWLDLEKAADDQKTNSIMSQDM